MEVVGEIVEDLMMLAQQVEDSTSSTDFLLLRSHLVLDKLNEFVALTNSNISNVVFANLNEVAYRLFVKDRTTKGPGRPLLDIPQEMIEYYVICGYSCVQLARLLGVSERTIRRRLEQHGLRARDLYSDVTDDVLDNIVAEIQRHYPNAGYRIIHGHLRAQGLHIQTSRVRESVRRVDPLGTQLRALAICTRHRRQYSVSGPNAMWHIDGNHKLIRWRFVIHGGIDGFSRLIVYLSAATNNRASTVVDSFIGAVQKFGLPSRVRSDKGLENIEVAHFMVAHRGENRNSHITGRSVHNQRIERLWRDVYEQVLDLFYCLFYGMESESLLDPDNEVHLYALHWIFLPQLQRHLNLFQEAWNNHKLRTTGSQSPLQLWTTFQTTDDPDQASDDFGIDWEGPCSNEMEGVAVPQALLQRELTVAEVDTLPSPNVLLTEAVDAYCETVLQLTRLFG
ncbi:uncharacterized protein LOC143737598 [Siphateles boraxobius]|uniref:uncharacterized protein LOC130079464 n=1 Tax=Rhinichthys klamathensis goyatoka TaxID=3034132 RepID=UPI0024B51778|nr:uncharacterized protein LOC130079464 [Rhinichthys klamathensis goyatoka]